MEERGLNQSALAEDLGVSRAIVSSWLKGKKFPRPDKLLRLGVTLGLAHDALIDRNIANDPIVAFRRKAGRKTKDTHIEKAMEMGQLLERLVPYLPQERLFELPILKSPRLDYAYIQKAADRVRRDLGLRKNQVTSPKLIERLNAFEAVLIPVFHGSRDQHENALHIHLPASKTTWIYLNLDVNLHDFNFWIAHEIGHMLAPGMRGESAEDFADAFAQSLLFPESEADKTYHLIQHRQSTQEKIEVITELAQKSVVSPLTVYYTINSYAKAYGRPQIDLEREIFAAATSFNKQFESVSQIHSRDYDETAAGYIKLSKVYFKSPIFDLLKAYLSEKPDAVGYVQAVLNIPLADAKEIIAELNNG